MSNFIYFMIKWHLAIQVNNHSQSFGIEKNKKKHSQSQKKALVWLNYYTT
jgi:hypothetical protein